MINKEQTMRLTIMYVKALKDCIGSRTYDEKIQAMRDVFAIIDFDYETVEKLYDEEDGDYDY